MATPAAILAIEVKANTAAATAGLSKVEAEGRAAAATQGTLAKSSGKTSGALKKLGTAAKYGGVALAAGVVIEGKRAITVTQDLAKTTWGLHKNTGFATKSASGLASVLKARGIDSNKAQIAFKSLATQVQAANQGSETAVKTFKQLGISTKELHKGAGDLGSLMPKIAEGLKDVGSGANRTADAQKLFGRGALNLLPILRDGSKEYNNQIDLVNKYGAVLKGKALKNQVDLLASLRESKIAWQGMQVQLANALTPTLLDVNKQFQRLAQVMASDKLTPEEKFQKMAEMLRKDFKVVMDVVLKMIPEIANQVGKNAPMVAKAFVEGFLDADAWGKLALGAFFLSKFTSGGISGSLAKAGAWAGKKWVVPFFAAISERIAAVKALLYVSGAENAGAATGSKWGKGFRIGAIAALVVGTALIINEIRDRWGKQIQQAFRKAGKAVDNFGGKFKVFLAPVKFALHGVIDQTKLLWDAISTTSKLISDLIHGRWAEAWKDFKHLAGTAIRGVINIGKFLLGPFYDAAKWIRSKWKNIDLKAPFRGIAGFVSNAFAPIKDAIKFIVQKVKWLTDHIPNIPSLPSPGSLPGKALGAAKSLLPHQGGKVTPYGIQKFARGGQVGTDRVPALLTPGEFVIKKAAVDKIGSSALAAMNEGKVKKDTKGLSLEGQTGKKLAKDARKAAKDTAKGVDDELMKGHKVATADTQKFTKMHGQQMQRLQKDADTQTTKFKKNTTKDFSDTNQQSTQTTNRMKGNVVAGFNQMTGKTTKSTGKMQKVVGGDYRSMAQAASKGIGMLAAATNKALKALGVKPVAFGAKTAKPQKHQRGGHITAPGVPSTGDHIPAMLEKGEYVVNSKAAKKVGRQKLDALNFGAAPRFQKGGPVGMATGGTAGMQPNAAALATQFVQKFGGSISSGLRPGDPGFHGRGMAFDWVPGDANAATKYANQIGSQILEGIHNPAAWGRQVSWDSGAQVSPSFWGGATWADHVDHLHVAVAKKVAGVVGAAIKKIDRVEMTGPDGPLKDMGQAALDQIQGAANKYIAAHTPSGMDVGPGVVVKNLPKSLERYNHVWQQLSPGGGGGPTMPLNKISELAEWAGQGAVPGKTMGQVTIGESGRRPGAWGIDPGGTRGYGLWAITSGFNDALINRLGGVKQMFNPIVNAQAMAEIFKGQGLGAWYGTGAVTSPNAHYTGPMKQLGGLIEMGSGGDPGGNSKKPKPDKVTGKDVSAGLAALNTKSLFKLMGVLSKGPASIHEGLQKKVSGMLLKKIADVRKGTPVKPGGHLEGYLNELDVLQLKLKLHKKGKPHQRSLHDLYDFLGDPEDGFYTWQTLRNRKEEWERLKIKKQIASKTPGKKDDERIAKKIADFLGKKPPKPGGPSDDAVARTQQLFDFLKLLGPTTALSTFGKGGKLGAGRFGIAGESGPELIRGPATISSPQETSSMLSPSFDVRVFIGGRELTDIVDVQIDRSDRAKDLKRRTGVSPAR